jgi:predicted secreted protein
MSLLVASLLICGHALLPTSVADSAVAEQASVTEGVAKKVIDESFTGTVQIALHSHLEIRLIASLGAGFSWSLESSNGTALKYLGQNIGPGPAPAPRPGTNSQNTQIFTFESVEPGSSELRFVYKQPWMPKNQDDKRLTFRVRAE